MPQTSTASQRALDADQRSATARPRSNLSSAGVNTSTDPRSRERVRSAIVHDLTTMERLCLMLWYAERMSAAEIGRVMDMTESQVRAMHERVVDRLQRGLRAA